MCVNHLNNETRTYDALKELINIIIELNKNHEQHRISLKSKKNIFINAR